MADIKLNKKGTTSSFAHYARANKACFNCEVKLLFSQFQLDHIVPKTSKYGNPYENRDENLVCLCQKCNGMKGKKDATEFFGKVKFAKLQKLVAIPLNLKDASIVKGANDLAKSLESRKFSRMHKKQKSTGYGLYYKPDAVYMTDRFVDETEDDDDDI